MSDSEETNLDDIFDITALKDRVACLAAERLRTQAELAELRSRLVDEQNSTLLLRTRLDLVECHLRDARDMNARLYSKIQENEARDQ